MTLRPKAVQCNQQAGRVSSYFVSRASSKILTPTRNYIFEQMCLAEEIVVFSFARVFL